MAFKIPPTTPSSSCIKLCVGSYFGLYLKLLVLKFPQLWFLCQFVCAIAHNILDMLYRLCGFYCCVAPANLNYMPNLYGWPNNVLVVPLPRVGGGFGYY